MVKRKAGSKEGASAPDEVVDLCLSQTANTDSEETEALESDLLTRSLAEAQARLIKNATPDAIFKDLLLDFLKLTDSEYGFVGEVLEDEMGDEYIKVFKSASVTDVEDGAAFHNLNMFSGELIQTGQSVISNDPDDDLRIEDKPRITPPLKSFMGLPIVNGNQLLGMISVANRPSGYSDELAESLLPFLDACAVIIGTILDREEKKSTDEGLRKAKKELLSIMNANPDISYVVDMDGALIKWNDGLEELTGLSPDDLMHRHIVQFVCPEDCPVFAKQFKEALVKGESNSEVRFIKNDGSLVSYLCGTVALRNAEGDVVGFSAAARDISWSKRTETKLQRSKDQLQAIIDNSAASIYLKDSDCRYIMVNRHYEKLFQVKEKDVIGKTEHDIFPDEMADIYRANDMQVIETNSSCKSEEVVELDDGSHTFICVKFPIADTSGTPYAVGCISTDITDLKKVEDDLQLASKVVEFAAEGVIVTDLGAVIQSANPAFCKMVGYTPKELIGHNASLLKSGKHDEPFYKKFWGDLIGNGYWKGEVWNRRKNGDIFPQEISINGIRNDEGKVTHYAAIYDDITDRKKTEEYLLLASKVFETAAEGVLITDTDAVIQYANQALTDITGYRANEIIGNKSSLFKSGKHDKAFYVEMWGELLKNGRWKGEIWNRRKNGEIYLQQMTIAAIKDNAGVTTQYASLFQDITELRHGEEEIKYQAYHDILTGLPNRALFKDRLQQSIARVRRENGGLALLFVDIDDFKRVNDTFGHAAGDLLLQGMAMRLVASLREADTISRFAGDEFTVIVEDLVSEQDTVILARKIIETLSDPFMYRGKKLSTTVSVGIAFYPSDGTTVDELLKSADLAMYHVKDRTKNNYQLFDKTMNEKFVRRVEMEEKLQKAIENNEFVVYYQPKINISSGQIAGLEALVRWRQASGELVPPGAFIPLAEETALIVPIGESVLMQACLQLKQWHDNGHPDLTVAVNVSARQFDRKNLVEVVSATIEATGLDPRYLRLEVTESAMMKDLDTTLSTLAKLKKMGIKISMDDFGTGYSSLSNLRKFPIDELKIDRFFICAIPDDPEDSAIASTIISMAHFLKLRVVAEGVETEEQLEFLRVSGCGEIQGYYISPPIPPDAMTLFLKDKEYVIQKMG